MRCEYQSKFGEIITGTSSSVDRKTAAILQILESFTASIHTATVNFLCELTEKIKHDFVVEIGCFVGFSILHIAKACNQMGNGVCKR